MDERLPQFLHRPVQILWFDAQEFIVVMSAIFVAVIVGGLVGWALIGALLLFIPWKRTKPRGFIPHAAWRWGLLRFRHYAPARGRTGNSPTFFDIVILRDELQETDLVPPH